jgi:hypothetical protein
LHQQNGGIHLEVELRYSVMTPVGQVFNATGLGKPGGPGGPGGPATAAFSPAKRLGSLENKTVYLVDTGFGGSYKFMQQLQKWFARNMPSVTTIRKRKSGGVFMDDTSDLWEEIKAKGDAAVVGVGG